MLNPLLLSVVVFWPMILQSTDTQNPASATAGDPLRDFIITILGIIAIVITPIATNSLRSLKSSIEEYRAASAKNTKGVENATNDIAAISTRLSQLESDLSRAILERDEAKAALVTANAAHDAAMAYVEAQIRILKKENTYAQAELVTERVINAELASNIQEMKDKILTLEGQVKMLQDSSNLIDTIVKRVKDTP